MPQSANNRDPRIAVFVGALLTTVRRRIIIWLYHGGKDEKCGLDTMKFYSAIQNHVIYWKMDILKIISLSNIRVRSTNSACFLSYTKSKFIYRTQKMHGFV